MAPSRVFHTLRRVLIFLRVIGVTNAGIWFGAAIFFTFGAAPAFFSKEMLDIFPRAYAGAAAQIVVERYYLLQYWCGAIALAHLTAEWLYTSRPMRRWVVFLVVALFGLALIGGLWVQPKLQKLHLQMYGVRATQQQREQATKSFRIWHGAAQTANFLMTLGLLAYFLQITASGTAPRFVPANKFRG